MKRLVLFLLFSIAASATVSFPSLTGNTACLGDDVYYRLDSSFTFCANVGGGGTSIPFSFQQKEIQNANWIQSYTGQATVGGVKYWTYWGSMFNTVFTHDGNLYVPEYSISTDVKCAGGRCAIGSVVGIATYSSSPKIDMPYNTRLPANITSADCARPVYSYPLWCVQQCEMQRTCRFNRMAEGCPDFCAASPTHASCVNSEFEKCLAQLNCAQIVGFDNTCLNLQPVDVSVSVSSNTPPVLPGGYYSDDQKITFDLSLTSCSKCVGNYNLAFFQDAFLEPTTERRYAGSSDTVKVSLGLGETKSITLKIRDLREKGLILGPIAFVQAVREYPSYAKCSSSLIPLRVNNRPVLRSLTLTPRQPVPTSEITCLAVAEDVDGGTPEIEYSFKFNTDPQTSWKPENPNQNNIWSCPPLEHCCPPGRQCKVSSCGGCAANDRITCYARAKDAQAPGVYSDVLSDEVIVGNNQPIVTIPSLTPSSPTTYDTITCTASGSDPDCPAGSTDPHCATPPVLTYSFARNSESFSDWSSSSDYDCSSNDCRQDDVISCKARMEDPQLPGLYGFSSISSVTVVNTLPVIRPPTLAPGDPAPGNELTCTSTAYDPDGGSPLVEYSFKKISKETGLSNGFSQWSASNAYNCPYCSAWDTVTCKARARDVQESSLYVYSSEATTSYSRWPDLIVRRIWTDLPYDAKYDVNQDLVVNETDWLLVLNTTLQTRPSCVDYTLSRCDFNNKDGFTMADLYLIMNAIYKRNTLYYPAGGKIHVEFSHGDRGYNAPAPLTYAAASLWKKNGPTALTSFFSVPPMPRYGDPQVITIDARDLTDGAGTYVFEAEANVGWYGGKIAQESTTANNKKAVELNVIAPVSTCQVSGPGSLAPNTAGAYSVQCFSQSGASETCPPMEWSVSTLRQEASPLTGTSTTLTTSFEFAGQVSQSVDLYATGNGVACSKTVLNSQPRSLSCMITGPASVQLGRSGAYSVSCANQGVAVACPQMTWTAVSGVASPTTGTATNFFPVQRSASLSAAGQGVSCSVNVEGTVPGVTPTPGPVTPTPSVVTPTPRVVTPVPANYVDVSCPLIGTAGTAEISVFQVSNGILTCPPQGSPPTITVTRNSVSASTGNPVSASGTATFVSCSNGVFRYSVPVTANPDDAQGQNVNYVVQATSSTGASKSCSMPMLKNTPSKAPDLNVLVVLFVAMAAAAIASRKRK